MRRTWTRSLVLLLSLGLLTPSCVGDRVVSAPESRREYGFRADGEGFSAVNAAHRLHARVDAEGVGLGTPRAGAPDEPLRLRLLAVERGSERVAVGSGSPSARGARAEIARPELELVEWYTNGADGLEQGFTFARAPLAGEGDVVLRIGVDAGRASLLSPGAKHLELAPSHALASFHYGKLVVRDAGGRELPSRMGASGAEIDIRFDDRGATYPIVVDPLVSTAVWAPEGTGGDDRFATSAMTAGDFNCDGISDLAVGVPQDDENGSSSGSVYVWFGAAGPLPTNPFEPPDWTSAAGLFANEFGYSVAGAGDVNGDGCDDLLVGAAFGNQSLERAMLFLGQAPSGPATTPVWQANGFPSGPPGSLHTQMGHKVAAGDLNGDRFADIIVSQLLGSNGQDQEGAVFVWLGNANIATQADGTAANADWRAECNQVSCGFGESIASGGDVNGDGFDDLVVGAPSYAGFGTAFAWYGGATFASDADGTPNNADWSFTTVSTGGRSGAAVAIVGDMNGDGYADVAVGTPLADLGPGLTDAGVVSLLRGGAGGISTSPTNRLGTTDGGQLGAALASAGDVNGDGRADLVMGEPLAPISASQAGRAHLILGASNVFSSAPSAVVYQEPNTINQVGNRARFGATVGTAGDLNGDGLSDVVVGAPDFGLSLWGKAWVYLGGTETVAAAAGFSTQPDQPEAVAGIGLGFAGDVNGDGYSDYAVGASQFDAGNTDEGRLLMVYGGSCGPACAPFYLLPPDAFEGNQDGAHLGYSVSGAGDVNNDGYSDVIAGAPEFDPFVFPSGFRIDAGIAMVYYGSSSGLDPSGTGLTGGSQSGASFGQSVANAGDLNGDGYGDVVVGAPNFDFAPLTDCGRVYVYYGSTGGFQPGIGILTGTENSGRFGTAVATAGDVNRDGYSDVLVGAVGEGAGDEGRVYLHLGGPSGLNPVAARVYSGEGGFAEFGYAVAGAGDVNGDGFSDYMVGSPGLNAGLGQNQGRFYLYLGAATPPATAATTRSGEIGDDFFSSDSRMGSGVSSAGDVNGDGLSDVIVGSHWFTGGAGFAQGRAYVYHGDAATGNIALLPQRVLQDCPTSFCDFGLRVAQAGDANGDGFSDVVVSAFKFSQGQLYEGGAFLHFGNGGPGIPRSRWQTRSSGSRIDLLGNANDFLFNMWMHTTSPAGRAPTKLLTEVGEFGAPFGPGGLVSSVGSALGGQDIGITGGLNFGRAGKWRARIRTFSPLFPPSPWFTLPGNAVNETDLRAGMQDSDFDQIPDAADNCPSVANPGQQDGGGGLEVPADGVGDACDNCVTANNPRQAAGYLATNPWRTLTGDQIDDDHDGYGNKCDAKFVGSPSQAVGGLDLAQFRASNTEDRRLDTCGTTNVRPCAIFDLDEAAAGDSIGGLDLGRFRQLNAATPGPRCAACTGTGSVPLPCTAGTAGTCF